MASSEKTAVEGSDNGKCVSPFPLKKVHQLTAVKKIKIPEVTQIHMTHANCQVWLGTDGRKYSA